MNPAGATGEVRLRRIESTVRIAPKPLSWLKRVGETDREYVRTPDRVIREISAFGMTP